MRRTTVVVALGLFTATAGVASAAPAEPVTARLVHVHSVWKSPAPPAPSGANCSNAGTESGTYVFTGWKVQQSHTAHLNTATVPSYLGSVTQAMQNAFSVWSQAEAAAPKISVATDGTITKPTANRSYDLMFGRTSGSALAVTYTWRWSDGFIESDTIFSTGVEWFQASSEGDGCYETVAKYDVQNIAAHEFGHTYGLDHPSGARFETMYAYGYTGETLKRSPATGDVAGVRALY